MCGILGQLALGGAPVDAHRVVRAGQSLRHRGPDDEGYLLAETSTGRAELRSGPDTAAGTAHPRAEAPCAFAPDLVLGHRRLAIIDLSPGGHEPMTFGRGDLWLTYNGEVYNYLELREELKSAGRTFATEGDGEVILQAYDAWGVDCVQRFIGMFAFVIWDAPRRRLFCARDRLGIKPFYYAAGSAAADGGTSGGTPGGAAASAAAGPAFSFASEVKALRVLAPEACRPNLPFLFRSLATGRVFDAPRTFFEGVRELPGGHRLLVENGRVGAPERWWDVDLERSRATYDYADPEREFLRLLRDSVKLRLRSDVPVGTCLSGGIDSSAIVALATEQLHGGRMYSYSTDYPVKGYDESRYIDLVAERYRTIRHEITPTPDEFLPRLETITWHQDIPTNGASVYSQHFVMRLAQGKVVVLLDGQGADEMFAGYLGHVTYQMAHLRRTDPARWLVQGSRFALEAWSRFNPALSWREFAFRVSRHLTGQRGRVRVLRPELEAQGLALGAGDARRSLRDADPLNDLLYRALVADSIPALLHYEDRNSMAFSLEARVPYLDHRLVEFALGVPAELKVRGPESKRLMRRALRGVLPDEIVERKDKLGYPTPFSAWIRGPLEGEVRAFLFDRVAKRDWYERAQVEAVWRDHRAGKRDLGNLIYGMIVAEMWMDRCVEN